MQEDTVSEQHEAVIVSACWTAIGRFMGTLSTTPAPQLGAIAIREAVQRAGIDPAIIDETFMGCVVPNGMGQAPARQAVIDDLEQVSLALFQVRIEVLRRERVHHLDGRKGYKREDARGDDRENELAWIHGLDFAALHRLLDGLDHGTLW